MGHVALLLALLANPGTDDISPYASPEIVTAIEAPEVIEPAEAPIIGGLALHLMFGLIADGEVDDVIGTIDFDVDQTYFVAAALWYQAGPSILIEFRLKYEAETDLSIEGIGDVDEIDSAEATVALVYEVTNVAGTGFYLLIGGGWKGTDGDTVFEEESDAVYMAGAVLKVTLGTTVSLVIDARANWHDTDSDELLRYEGAVGLGIDIG